MSIRKIVLILVTACSLFAQGNFVSVAFDDLPKLLEQSSPLAKIISAERDKTVAERDVALQWSNPELNLEREQVEKNGSKETEQVLYLSKSFDLPWNYLWERRAWKAEMNAADLERQQKMKGLLAKTRSAYVQISLLRNLSAQLAGLKEMLNGLSQTVTARQEEGALSWLDGKLIAMGLFGLEAGLLQTQQDYRHALGEWKETLGIDHEQEVKLTTVIEFKHLQYAYPEKEEMLKSNPGLQAHRKRIEAVERRVSLEKSRVVSSFTLEGGYKKVNPGWEGYTLGVSVPLPVMNWNGAHVEQQKIERNIQMAETSLHEQRLVSEMDNLVKTLQGNMELLARNSSACPDIKIAEDLLASYKEGALSLLDFLSAIQIFRDGSKQYTEQLAAYYRVIFELEVLSGKRMVRF